MGRLLLLAAAAVLLAPARAANVPPPGRHGLWTPGEGAPLFTVPHTPPANASSGATGERADPWWAWDVPCAPQYGERRELRCYPGNRAGARCFRGVFDGFASAAEADALHAAQAAREAERAASGVYRPLDLWAEFPLERVQALLQAEFGVDDVELRLTHHRVDLGGPDSYGYGECHMHSDFHAHQGYVYTAIVYLNDFGADFEGGETGISDTPRARSFAAVAEGVVVQPRKGRLLAFTGGAENMHCRLPVTAGHRAVLQTWWSC